MLESCVFALLMIGKDVIKELLGIGRTRSSINRDIECRFRKGGHIVVLVDLSGSINISRDAIRQRHLHFLIFTAVVVGSKTSTRNGRALGCHCGKPAMKIELGGETISHDVEQAQLRRPSHRMPRGTRSLRAKRLYSEDSI